MADEKTPQDDPASESETASEETASEETASEQEAATGEAAQDPDASSEEASSEEASSEAAVDVAADEASDQAAAEAPSADEASDTEASSDAEEAPTEEAPTEEAPTEEPPSNGQAEHAPQEQEAPAHRATVEDLLKAGTHYGHLTSRWHPRMKKHIFMERSNIHIIDLMQTQVLLDQAADAARRFAARGKNILFVGTKKQAQEIVRTHAERCGQPHMVERWLGGTMTNFQTIRRSIRRMEEIEKMEADGTLDKLKKKERLVRLREHDKLEATLGGIRKLARLPSAIYVVDVRRERIAVREAQKLGIPVIAMVDTNCDPSRVEYPVPSNDDALSSIELVTAVIADAIEEGRKERQAKEEADQQKAQQQG